MLKPLVGIVDAELLEAVGLEILKAKYIQDSDGQTLKPNQQTCVTSPPPKKGSASYSLVTPEPRVTGQERLSHTRPLYDPAVEEDSPRRTPPCLAC